METVSGKSASKTKPEGKEMKSSRGSGSRPGGGAPREPSDPISAGLRKLWDEVALEPVPDDFLSLLEKIDSQPRGPDAPNPEPDSAA